MTSQIDLVNKYYKASAIDYGVLWTKRENYMGIHFGYYSTGNETHDESLVKLNKFIARKANIKKKDKVLDAGCGYGGSSHWLAEKIGCRVTGINVVPFQIEKAINIANKKRLNNLIDFHIKDYAQTDFPEDSYTTFMAIESVVHAKSKEKVMLEAYRVLAKGGKLVLAEYLFHDDYKYTKDDNNLLDVWLKGWSMPNLSTKNQYEKILKKVGFKNIKFINITKNVTPSLKLLANHVKIGLPIARLLTKMKIFSQTHLGNVEASSALCQALERGLWNYFVITAEK